MLGFGALLKHPNPQEKSLSQLPNGSSNHPKIPSHYTSVDEDSIPIQKNSTSDNRLPPSDIASESLRITNSLQQTGFQIDSSCNLSTKIYF